MTRTPIPQFARDFPDLAQTLEQARLPFYCINCYRKRETTYLTPNFGPFCDECLEEVRREWNWVSEAARQIRNRHRGCTEGPTHEETMAIIVERCPWPTELPPFEPENYSGDEDRS